MTFNLFIIEHFSDSATGFDLLSFSNGDNSRALIGFWLDHFGDRIVIDFLFFQFRINL